MKSIKREFSLYSFYDHTNIQKHLEAMALKGWMLEKIGNFGWVYRKTEPRFLHFAITYFPNASEFDSHPSQEQQIFLDYCAQAGWQPVAHWAQMLIFCNEAENPVAIETDAAVQVDTIHSAMKKNYLIGQAVLIALALLQIGTNLHNLFRHPIDTLANPSFPFLILNWALVIVECGVEAFSYLLWHRRAKRAAELEGSFTPTRSHRSFQLVCLAVLIPFLLLWLLSLGGRLAAAGIGGILVMLLLQFLVNIIKQLMKRTGCSTAVNRAVTLISSFVLAVALIGGLTYCTIHSVWNRTGHETYTYLGYEYDISPISLPLTIEDLTEQSYEHISRDRLESTSFFLSRQSCYETVQGDSGRIRLSYEITDVKRPWLWDMVVQDYLGNTSHTIRHRTVDFTFSWYWLPEEIPDTWGADAAYRKYWDETTPADVYLLFFGDRVAEIEFDEEPTAAQRAIVGEKLKTAHK